MLKTKCLCCGERRGVEEIMTPSLKCVHCPQFCTQHTQQVHIALHAVLVISVARREICVIVDTVLYCVVGLGWGEYRPHGDTACLL